MRWLRSLPMLLCLGGGLAGCERARESRPAPTPLLEQMPPVDPARTIEGRLLVAGMTCSGCEYNVSTALRLVPGVLSAEADHASGVALVRFDPSTTSLERLAEAVRTTGYVVAPTEDRSSE